MAPPRSRTRRHPILRTVLLLLPLATTMTAAHAADAPPARILVKYRDVDACVACLAATGRSMASITGSPSLDALHRQLRVRGITSLLPGDTSLARGRRDRFAARIDAVRKRFPARAARASTSVVPDMSSIYVLDLGADVDPEKAAALYAADPAVAWAEPDRTWSVVLTTDDPFLASSGTWGQSYPDLWGLGAIDATTAWDRSTGTGILVAAIDTGVDYTHADLAANLWTNPGEIPGNGIDDDGNGFVDDVRGWDFADGDADPYDDHGHGTHVAGTIAAVGNNARGVVGVAWGARLMPVRGLDHFGNGSTSALAAALVYAAENGADVLSNSWGGVGHSDALQDAVTTARALGAVVLAAAGNLNAPVSAFEPAGLAGVISVGAITPTGDRASFSNFGTGLSVTAPGVDVLSCRSHDGGPVGGSVVATDYVRLSGTSMACPHAAGVAALLLADQPTLTADEVQWHLELSATQPGAAGWEGQPWNPYFGYGVVDAARVFDPVPVTTRLAATPLDLHGFVDELRPGATTVPLVFTSTAAVPWDTTAPSWLVATPSSGTTGATLDVGLDLTGMTPGTYQGDLTVSAPSAVDGGGTVAATVHAHRDERVGTPFPIGGTFRGGSKPTYPPPALASDGLGTLVVWSDQVTASGDLYAARIDGAGGVTPTVTVHTGFPQKEQVGVAYDGGTYLIAWKSSPRVNDKTYDQISVMRVGPDGQPLDAAPIVLRTVADQGRIATLLDGVAFDGEAFVVVWTEVGFVSNAGKVLMQRVGADGSIRERKPVKLYPSAATATNDVNRFILPRIACAATNCLLAWVVRDGLTDAFGAPIDKVYAARLVHGRFVDDAPFLALTNATYLADLATDGTDYMPLAHRFSIGAGPRIVGGQVVAGRVRADGTALDVAGIRLDNGSDGPSLFPKGTQLAFDGTDYVGVMSGGGTNVGSEIFLNRVSRGGQSLEDETEGLLAVTHAVDGPDDAAYAAVTARDADSLVVWSKAIDDPDLPSWQNQLYGQRMLAHPSALPTVTLGAIGDRQLAEGETLRVTIVANGLDPAATTYTASNLPPGAVFDAALHGLRWTPAADQAGASVTTHFEATDGTQVVSEDVAFTVTEAEPSIVGTVHAADGVTPLPGVGLELKGPVKWTGHTDATGRYVFADLPPGSYTLKLDRTAKKLYRATPPALRVVVGAADVRNVDVSLAAK